MEAKDTSFAERDLHYVVKLTGGVSTYSELNVIEASLLIIFLL